MHITSALIIIIITAAATTPLCNKNNSKENTVIVFLIIGLTFYKGTSIYQEPFNKVILINPLPFIDLRHRYLIYYQHRSHYVL